MSGGAPLSGLSRELSDGHFEDGEGIMILSIFVSLLAMFFAALCYVAWRIWSPEIRARLLCEGEIEKLLQDLIDKHGIKNADGMVTSFCYEAMQRHDLFGVALWERVTRRLRRRRNGRTDNGGQ